MTACMHLSNLFGLFEEDEAVGAESAEFGIEWRVGDRLKTCAWGPQTRKMNCKLLRIFQTRELSAGGHIRIRNRDIVVVLIVGAWRRRLRGQVAKDIWPCTANVKIAALDPARSSQN
jgi:hypothetical protein